MLATNSVYLRSWGVAVWGIAALVADVIPRDADAQAPTGISEKQLQASREVREELAPHAEALSEAGRAREAIVVAKNIIAVLGEAYGEKETMADWWSWIAIRQERLEDFAAAKQSRNTALAIKTRLFGSDHWKVTDALVDFVTTERLEKLSRVDRQRLADAEKLISQVDQLKDEGKYRQAVPPAERAIAIRRAVLGPKHPDYGQAVSYLGLIYDELGDYARAERYHQETVEITKNVLGTAHPKYTTSLNNLAHAHFAQGRLDRAVTLFSEVVEIEKRSLGEASPKYAVGLSNLAAVLLQRGDSGEATRLLEQALAIVQKSQGPEHLEYAHFAHSLACAYGSSGDFARAVPLFQAAVEIVKKAQGAQHPTYGTYLRNQAECLARMGDLSRAEALYYQVLEVWKETIGMQHPSVADVLTNLGDLQCEGSSYRPAEVLYRQALEIRRRVYGEHHSEYATSLCKQAGVVAQLGNPTAAEALYRRAGKIFKDQLGESHFRYALVLNQQASLHFVRGDFAGAKPLLAQSAEIRRKLPAERRNLSITLNELAWAHLWLDEYEEARACFRESLEIERSILNAAAAVQSERQQLAMLLDNSSVLECFLGLALKAPRYRREALEEVLNWQGAVLRRQRAMREVSGRPELAATLQELQQTAQRLATLSLASDSEQLAASWKEQIAQLSLKQEQLEAKLAAASAEIRQANTPFTVKELQSALRGDTALVVYFEFAFIGPKDQMLGQGLVSEQRLIAFVVRSGGEVQLVDLGEPQPIAKAVEEWREAVQTSADFQRFGKVLRERLWDPVEPHLAGAATVLVVPYRDFGKLPFGALAGRAAGTFLLEDYAVAVLPVPQAVEWLNVDKQHRSGPEMLLVGDVDYDRKRGAAEPAKPASDGASRAPREEQDKLFSALPGTGIELASIGALFQEHYSAAPKTLRGVDASEANLTEGVQQCRYLHFATHGYFAAERFKSAMSRSFAPAFSMRVMFRSHQSVSRYHPGLLSGLALAGANQPNDQEDGILTAAEVSFLKLPCAELVVLSACETGLGNTAGGEGLLGLQRAFQVAGAQAVVASLWSVPDQATKALMVRFYENLWKRKMSKLEALREAQLWMLKEGAQQPEVWRAVVARGLDRVEGGREQETGNRRRLAPYFWAAWVLSGDWR